MWPQRGACIWDLLATGAPEGTSTASLPALCGADTVFVEGKLGVPGKRCCKCKEYLISKGSRSCLLGGALLFLLTSGIPSPGQKLQLSLWIDPTLTLVTPDSLLGSHHGPSYPLTFFLFSPQLFGGILNCHIFPVTWRLAKEQWDSCEENKEKRGLGGFPVSPGFSAVGSPLDCLLFIPVWRW